MAGEGRARKRFMRDVYSRYWSTAREEKYGFLEYDRRLCDLLAATRPPPARLLEVAVGTGYPFAEAFAQRGYHVHGADISPLLVAQCRARVPAAAAVAADAEHLPYRDASFDVAYSFHSTWYFPDLASVLDEMLRVARPGGWVLLDLQNREHPAIEAAYRRRLAEARGPRRLVRYARNLGMMALRRGAPVWGTAVPETPTWPREVLDRLRPRASELRVFARRGEALEERAPQGPFADAERLVVVARRAPLRI